jgi:hypothetical protein
VPLDWNKFNKLTQKEKYEYANMLTMFLEDVRSTNSRLMVMLKTFMDTIFNEKEEKTTDD